MSLSRSEKAEAASKEPDYSWDATIKTFLMALVLALTFRSLFFEPFHIPSGSMKNTLQVGDYLFVSKYSYGYGRYSFPLGLPLFEGRIAGEQPERGDVVVFRLPSNPRVDFIKRVVGLPGDTVQVMDGVLYLNEKPVQQRRLEDSRITTDDGNIVETKQYEETLPNGKTHRTLDMTPMGDVDNTPLFEVPEKHYFVMGDNRDNSTDSRYMGYVGFVPEENLIGRAELILFSLKEDVRFWQFWKWWGGFRGERFFKDID